MSANQPAGNPVSASLLTRLKDQQLHDFVARWDSLEQLAVSAYRDQQQDAGRSDRFYNLLSRLLQDYSRWETALGRALQSIQHQSHGAEPKPFKRILHVSSLAELQGDWEIMRCFPQAREAINLYLLERLAEEEQGGA